MSNTGRLRTKATNFGKRMVFRANRALGNYRDVVWIVGDGRSGTTWVSDLVNHDGRFREMFEPLHPQLVKAASFVQPHQYCRPGAMDDRLRDLMGSILSGGFCDPRVDFGNKALVYEGLLVKDIFANLMCYAACQAFPQVRPVLLIRNPFAVAASKYKKRDWFWGDEPLDLLNQPALREDFLAPFEDLIRQTSARGDFILNQVLIWAIVNYVPLQQFAPEGLHVCFYEQIYADPEGEISRLFRFIRNGEDCHVKLDDDLIRRPSRVVKQETSFKAGSSPVTSWKNEIDPQRIDDGLRLLEAFGFDGLYNDASMPDAGVLKRPAAVA